MVIRNTASSCQCLSGTRRDWSTLAFVIVLVGAGVTPASSHDDPQLILVSDGPAVLDSVISFSAHLVNADHIHGPFWFRWNDDASPGHFLEEQTNHKIMNHSLCYSSNKYEEKTYTMTVTVFKEKTFYREEIASNRIDYRITKQLNGDIAIHQPSLRGNNVSSKENVMFEVKLHDPSGFLNGSMTEYFWFINDTNYGPTEKSVFFYKFSKPGISSVEVMVLAKVGPEPSGHGGIWRNASEKLRSASSLSGAMNTMGPNPTEPPYVKSGVFRTNVRSIIPMINLTVSGDTWLKHGKLLRLNLRCDGSGPFNFCWSVKDTPYNVTGNETCIDSTETYDDCNIELVWYFRNNGTFDILSVIENGISKLVEVVHVNIYQVHHQTPLSLVVVPICSCLVAVIAIGSGVFVWTAYKRNMPVETADFDFNSPDEQLEYKTFWERLRDSMVNAFGNASDDVSHISSVSSRHDPPPANIHYGSIR